MAGNVGTLDPAAAAAIHSGPIPHQPQFYDDQDNLNVDIGELYTTLITPIDQIRSYLGQNPQESRINAFYRMTGLPIVATDGSGQYYSPGYDPNLNLDVISQSKYTNIANIIIANTNFTSTQLDVRENNTQKYYLPIFAAQTLNAIALAIGSVFVRSFEKQLTDGIVFPAIDKGQEQNIDDRVNYITAFYSDEIAQINGGDVATLMRSKHYLRPFIVDPRIASNVIPTKNNICAPFLYDKTQTKIIDNPNGGSTYLRRPYIERVITTRLSNSLNSNNPTNNQAASQSFLNALSSNIQSNQAITDQGLLQFTANQTQYYSSEIMIYQGYFRQMRAILQTLHDSIDNVMDVEKNLNWQPTPDPKLGPEAGGTLNSVSNDGQRNANYQTRYPNYELDILDAQARNYIDQAQFDLGLSGTTDPGDFAFSNLDDTVFDARKSATKSYQDLLDKLNNIRNRIGNDAITSLKNIEIIMGEFGGIGLLDILSIQATLWVMPISSLLGLIDQRAFARLQKRTDLNSTSLTQNSIAQSMADLDSGVSINLKLIQQYFDDLKAGDFSLTNQNN
jgi:hypothetical protein